MHVLIVTVYCTGNLVGQFGLLTFFTPGDYQNSLGHYF